MEAGRTWELKILIINRDRQILKNNKYTKTKTRQRFSGCYINLIFKKIEIPSKVDQGACLSSIYIRHMGPDQWQLVRMDPGAIFFYRPFLTLRCRHAHTNKHTQPH